MTVKDIINWKDVYYLVYKMINFEDESKFYNIHVWTKDRYKHDVFLITMSNDPEKQDLKNLKKEVKEVNIESYKNNLFYSVQFNYEFYISQMNLKKYFELIKGRFKWNNVRSSFNYLYVNPIKKTT